MAKHKMYHASFWRRWALLAVGLALLAGGGTMWIIGDRSESSRLPNPVIGRMTPSQTVLPEPSLSATPSVAPAPTSEPVPATEPFVPTTLSIEQVGSRPVQSLGRTTVGENGFSLPDPTGSDSATVFAWDREGAKPGSSQGTVNFTAHTYPPGAGSTWQPAVRPVAGR